MKTAFIRADASLAIGTGHVMRCLVLADALKGRGADVHFLCRAHEGHLGDLIAGRGFAVHLLPPGSHGYPDLPDAPPHAAWLGALPEEDAAACREVIVAAGGADLLVVDHYALDHRFETPLRAVTRRILVVDDLADRRHDCDVLVDQNFGSDDVSRYAGLVPPAARLLVGPRHALLATAYAEARGSSLARRDGGIRRILVFLGGVDADNVTMRTLEVCARLAGLTADRQIIAVVGPSNRHRQDIEAFASGHGNVRILPPQPSLAALMTEADLAIGAGGVAALERAALGLPSITITVADNQIRQASALAEAGATVSLGRVSPDFEPKLEAAIALLLQNPPLVRRLSTVSAALCDGRGLARLLDEIDPPVIDLRHAARGDAETMWRWRNHPDTRRYSGSGDEIPFQQHRAWLDATLQRSDRLLLIGSDPCGDVGVLRFDIDGETAIISVYLAPERRGEGLGRWLISAGGAYLRAHRPVVTGIIAHVRADNASSRRAFAAAGYAEESLTLTLRLGPAAGASMET
jgi:UDP-2,4-diacetamido-2,4,6-trideoxy-beta-L-altropyranose hydrolase